MILADKIIYLRKKAGWSQEDLAGELNVSRQSVSKWEGALSIPDMDKILMMSQVFGVSTDFLLKDEEEVHDGLDIGVVNEGVSVSIEEANRFIDHSKIKSSKIATAVSMFILSPIFMFLAEYLSINNKLNEKLGETIGVSILILIVAFGIFIIISTVAGSTEFEYLDKKEIQLMYGVSGILEKQRLAFAQSGYIQIGVGVVLCLISVLPMIFLDELFVGSEEIGAALLIVCVSVGVHLLVRTGVMFGTYDRLLQRNDYSVESKKANKIIGLIAGPYWLLTTAIYLLLSFTSGAWDQTWIVWPIAGIIFGIIAAIINSIYGHIN